MKKIFNAPLINAVDLAPEEPVMEGISSTMLIAPGANNVGGKTITYSITDADRDEANKQKYWSGK